MHHCGRFLKAPLTRREMLARCAGGFGGVAFLALSAERAAAAANEAGRGGQHPPRARSIIFLYMDGGPSQVDTFDPKPRLAADHGKPFPMRKEPTQFNDDGTTLASPWSFERHGKSGIPVSSLFPAVARLADDLCVVRSMVSNFSEHTTANYFLHSGLGLSGRPSMGAWAVYGLGSDNDNLPGFVVLNGGLTPPGGVDCFGSGFLPASYQGSILRPGKEPVANIRPADDVALQERKLRLVRRLDSSFLAKTGPCDPVESAIANHELAFRMQVEVPGLLDIGGETGATRRLYGLEASYPPTRIFGLECLLARRLVERGVRFIELTCPVVASADRWDQHGNLKKGHENNALSVDQPIAGLLEDLKARGLLEETLVVWAGEFGRTPFAQGSDGRDHNPYGFSIWLAGGGIRGGMIHGATDEFGYRVIEGKVEVHDLHATMLHLLGIDHRRLTFRHGGRDMRLTDVHGEVVMKLLA